MYQCEFVNIVKPLDQVPFLRLEVTGVELSYLKILNLVPVVCYYPQGRGHVLCPKQPDLLMPLLDEVPEGLVQVKAELLQAGPRAPQAVVGVMLS